jgi:hypothetical protein
MTTLSFKAITAALLLGGSGLAMAANDGQSRANELLSADPQYRETWQGVVKKEERLPEWLTGRRKKAQLFPCKGATSNAVNAYPMPNRHGFF